MPYPISAVHSRRFVAAYADRMRMLFGASVIGYWPLWEASGATANDISPQANNGTYSNVTLAQAGIGDGRTSASFNGTTSYVDVYSAGLASDFNGQEITIAIFVKVVGIWPAIDFISGFIVNGSNYCNIYKTNFGGSGAIVFEYTAGGTYKSVTSGAQTSTDWLHLALTASLSGNALKGYINGVQEGATVTGLGTWAGSLLSTGTCIGAANTTPDNSWNGYLTHAILLNRAATAPEVAEAARASV